MMFEVSVKHISQARCQMLWIGFAGAGRAGAARILEAWPSLQSKGQDLSYETYLKSSSAHAYALNPVNYYNKSDRLKD